MNEIVTEGAGNIPEQPVLVLPNRVNLAIMQELEKQLGGPDRVAWLVEQSLQPEPNIMQHLQQTRAAGCIFSVRQQKQSDVVTRLRPFAEQGRHLVLLPGRPAQLRSGICDYPSALLTFFDTAPIPVLPVFCGMFNDGPEDTITTTAPTAPIHLRILPRAEANTPQNPQNIKPVLASSKREQRRNTRFISTEKRMTMRTNGISNARLSGVR